MLALGQYRGVATGLRATRRTPDGRKIVRQHPNNRRDGPACFARVQQKRQPLSLQVFRGTPRTDGNGEAPFDQNPEYPDHLRLMWPA